MPKTWSHQKILKKYQRSIKQYTLRILTWLTGTQNLWNSFGSLRFWGKKNKNPLETPARLGNTNWAIKLIHADSLLSFCHPLGCQYSAWKKNNHQPNCESTVRGEGGVVKKTPSVHAEWCCWVSSACKLWTSKMSKVYFLMVRAAWRMTLTSLVGWYFPDPIFFLQQSPKFAPLNSHSWLWRQHLNGAFQSGTHLSWHGPVSSRQHNPPPLRPPCLPLVARQLKQA